MPQRFCFRDTKCSMFVLYTDIVRFEANGSYTLAFLNNGETKTICSCLCTQYEKGKSSGLFFRIHKSHVVNTQYVSYVFNNGTVRLIDGTELPCNPKEKEELLRLMMEG